ncbi:MAG: flagellar hook-associated protein 3 [Cyanobacteria bacterium SIG28]|nr:flagellar hook-associated protein 3 [Cyanobacteria bacterium SIG28]
MVDRITSSSRYAQLVADMQMNQYNFNKLTAQLSSGNKITSITDDPIATVNILNTNKQLGQIEIFEENVGLASAELSALDDLLSLASGYLSKAWDKAIQANNQTYNDSSLKALQVEIDEIAKTIVDLANSEYNDNYIFSGANTKTVPFTIEEDGSITYNGTPYANEDYIRQTEVSDGVFEIINTTGDRVFGSYEKVQETNDDGKKVFTDPNDNDRRVIETVDQATGLKTYAYEDDDSEYTGKPTDLEKVYTGEEKYSGVLGALRMLSHGIEKVLGGEVQEGYDQMNASLDEFSNSLDTITTEQTKFGGIANRLEMTTSTLETNNENLTAYLSQTQDIDYAEAITQWMNAQYAYQASLQVSSASMNMSLLNYIQ